jgi:hypothetical protein
MQRQPPASEPAPHRFRRPLLHSSNRLPSDTVLNYAVECQGRCTPAHPFLCSFSLPTTSPFTPRSSPSDVHCALPSFCCSFSQSFSLFNIFLLYPDLFAFSGAVNVLCSRPNFRQHQFSRLENDTRSFPARGSCSTHTSFARDQLRLQYN